MGLDPRNPSIVLARAKGLIVEPQGSALGAVPVPGREVRTKQGDPTTMSHMVSVDYFGAVPNPTNARTNWQGRSRVAKMQRSSTWAALFDKPAETREALALGCTVTLTRISAGKLDSDNLQAAMKSFRDVVAAWLFGGQIGQRDGDERVTWVYRQERGKPRQNGARIEIETRA
jgi:hypothetical protein